jgi:hypothetical protein
MTRLTCPLQNGSSSALPDFACQISKEQQRLPHTNRGGWFSAEYELSIFLRFFFLGGLLGFGNIAIRGMTTAISGEALSPSGP